jgi:hypothetical protein
MKGKTKKKFKSNRANSTNLRSRIWDHDNLIKEKNIKIMKLKAQQLNVERFKWKKNQL